jgi:acetyl esterase/lipase
MIAKSSACCLALAVAAGLYCSTARAHEPRRKFDLEYARVGETPLLLDLYIPAHTPSPPVVVWVHGGAWRSGSKKDPPLLPLANRGIAVASVDYRLSPVAKFPAQAHDIKAAIRFLRAKSSELGLNAERIAIAGGSAGGHLAALVGVTNGVKEFEGDVGQNRDQSSDVQAIVVFYGASNLTTILSQSTPHGLNVRVPALELFLEGQLDETKSKAVIEGFSRGIATRPYDLARLASPVFNVDKADPPLLWYHGDQDPQMPINQAHEMIGAYKRQGLPARLEVVYGGVHGGKLFHTPEQLNQVAEFVSTCLQSPKP